MKSNLLAKSLFDFETKYFKEIKELKILNCNAWYVVKTPLYFGIITSYSSAGNKNVTTDHTLGAKVSFLGRKLWNIVFLLALFIKLYIKGSANKKLTLFYTSTTDKLAKDSKGNYFNFLADPFITNKIIPWYVYAEQSYGGEFKLPSAVKIDFRTDLLNLITSRYLTTISKQVILTELADKLFGLLEKHFFEESLPVQFTRQSLRNILINFVAEYKTSSIFLALVRPGLIITSERVGTGFMAAAKAKDIVTIDMQHGVIDRYHPQYMFLPQMNAIKSQMSLPSHIAVFGQYHKNQLLRDKFWTNEEIVVLGSSRIDANRRKHLSTLSKAAQRKIVLLPTQWTVFEETRYILQKLIDVLDSDVAIIIKLHPYERKENIEFYIRFAEKYKERIQVADRNSDIYDLISIARVLIGFDSAALLEAVSLGKPCVTVTTDSAPEGIHTLFVDEALKEAILPVALKDAQGLGDLLHRCIKDEMFYSQWLQKTKLISTYLYAENYIENCRNLAHKILPVN